MAGYRASERGIWLVRRKSRVRTSAKSREGGRPGDTGRLADRNGRDGGTLGRRVSAPHRRRRRQSGNASFQRRRRHGGQRDGTAGDTPSLSGLLRVRQHFPRNAFLPRRSPGALARQRSTPGPGDQSAPAADPPACRVRQFGLQEGGQKAAVFLSPHAPVRQRLLNAAISDSFTETYS